MIPQYGCNDLKMISTQAELIEELNDTKLDSFLKFHC